MTKERKLAIKMWKQIRKGIKFKRYFFGMISIEYLKSDFCIKHNLNWFHQCWFCQYIRRGESSHKPLGREGCNLCPIATKEAKLNSNVCGCGSYDSLWKIVTNEYLKTKVRLEACNKIIKALEGEKYE